MSEGLQVAMEAKLALAEVALESGDKLTAKDAAEHLDGKEEGGAGLDPVAVIQRQAAGGHHTMRVRVRLGFLNPRVGDPEEADRGAGACGTARDLEVRHCTGL